MDHHLPASTMDKLNALIRELHRRSVWQVLLVYLGAGWAVLQVIDQIIERFALPDSVYGIALILLLIGLPIVLATAIVQEGPPVPSAVIPEPAPPSPIHGLLTWRNALGGGALAFTLLVAGSVAWVAFGRRATADDESREDRPSIAVLPFENISPNEKDRFFTDGIHEEIISQLSRIQALHVISRTSVLSYRENVQGKLPQIARELGVRYILEGSVRRAESRARITAQLIDAEKDEHLWSDQYDEDLADIFAIQTKVAERIVASLNAELSPRERARVKHRPTMSTEAYDYYLRGNELQRAGYARESMASAIRMYERAIELDSSFALAHARLGIGHARMFWFFPDRSDARCQKARAAIDRALTLEAELPEAHKALAIYHYYCRLAYDDALAELESARAGLPGDGEIPATIGYIRRRQGNIAASIENLQRALRLDPRNGEIAVDLAASYLLARDYDGALQRFQEAAQLLPDQREPLVWQARVHLFGTGDVSRARQLVEEAAQRPSRESESVAYFAPYFRTLVELFDRKYAVALGLLADWPASVDNQFEFVPRALLRGQVLALSRNARGAAAAYDSARTTLEASIKNTPEDSRLYSALGLAYAGLGRRDEALRAARRGVALMPVEREAWRGTFRLQDLAKVHASVGEPDSAVAILSRLIKMPSELAPAALRLNPAWDRLRGLPAFQALVKQ